MHAIAPLEEIIKRDEKALDLYLEMFSREHENLFFAGGIEVASAIYGLLSLQGEVIAASIKAKQLGRATYRVFLEKKKRHQLNLKGQNTYIESQRHTRYVDKKRYQQHLHQHLQVLTG
ncbi:MAG: hypothetical protein AAF206_16505 [Bacteroidota bacterium]